MIIEIAGQEFEAKPWWRWVCVDDNGIVIAFWNKPSFQYWDKYKDGRCWDLQYPDYLFECLGQIDEKLVPRESLIRI